MSWIRLESLSRINNVALSCISGRKTTTNEYPNARPSLTYPFHARFGKNSKERIIGISETIILTYSCHSCWHISAKKRGKIVIAQHSRACVWVESNLGWWELFIYPLLCSTKFIRLFTQRRRRRMSLLLLSSNFKLLSKVWKSSERARPGVPLKLSDR